MSLFGPLLGFGRTAMTGDQLGALQQRRDAIRNAIDSGDFGHGIGAFGANLAVRGMDNRINNAFPSAPAAPAVQMQAHPMQQPMPQSGFDHGSVPMAGLLMQHPGSEPTQTPFQPQTPSFNFGNGVIPQFLGHVFNRGSGGLY